MESKCTGRWLQFKHIDFFSVLKMLMESEFICWLELNSGVSDSDMILLGVWHYSPELLDRDLEGEEDVVRLEAESRRDVHLAGHHAPAQQVALELHQPVLAEGEQGGEDGVVGGVGVGAHPVPAEAVLRQPGAGPAPHSWSKQES